MIKTLCHRFIENFNNLPPICTKALSFKYWFAKLYIHFLTLSPTKTKQEKDDIHNLNIQIGNIWELFLMEIQNFKGLTSSISVTHHWYSGISYLQYYPRNLCLFRIEWDILFFWKPIIFFTKVTYIFLVLEKTEKLSKLNTFQFSY